MPIQMNDAPRWRQLLLWSLVCCLLAILGATSVRANTTISFTLPTGQTSYRTSAAVYNGSGVMIRQLWKYISYAPGAHTYVWDDKDDSGTTVSGTFTVKVLYHNVNYLWDGVIANSSQDQSGYGVHRGNYFVTDMAIAGTTAMYASGNFEGPRDFTIFSTTTPRAVTQKIAWLESTNWNPKCGQVTGANGGASVPVTATLNMNFAAGTTGKVHIIWGGYCDNTQGGAKLTVTDVTAGTSFTSPAYPAMAFKMGYNTGQTTCHTVFKVGSCRQMTMSVVDNNDWNQLQRAYLQAVWVEDGNGSTTTTYDTTSQTTFDLATPPTYDIDSCVIGGSWLIGSSSTPLFSITRSPRSGFSLSCPAVGGGSDHTAICDFTHVGLLDDCENLVNWATNIGVNNFMATDGVWFYGASSSSYDTATEQAGLITPMWVDNGKQAYFLYGAHQKPYNGYSYNTLPNAIRVGTQPGLAGLAVQTTGNILAASVTPDNAVYLLNKRTGAPVGSIAVTAPGRLAMTPSGDLWVLTGTSAVRYTDLSSSPRVVTTITGFAQPLAIAVSPVSGDDTVIVADGGTRMQLSGYTNSGTYKWTYGQQGGYQTNGPTVSNTKFWFANDAFGQGNAGTFVTYQPDGSFWVGDAGNYRALHFSADRSQVLDEMAFQTLDYLVAVDMNNPTRVFNGFKEYQINYSQPLVAGNGSWTMVKNWRAGLEEKYWKGGYASGLVQVVTFPQNNRTYALIQRQDLWHQQELCELTATGVRPTGICVDGRYTVLNANGSLITDPAFNNIWLKQDVTGFDGSGNPQYGTAAELARAQTGSTDPIGGNYAAVTSTGVLAALDISKDNKFHLGGVQTGTSTWLWRAFPTVSTAGYESGQNFGDYDIGDGITYTSSKAIATGRHIVCDFHGEFWKQSQAGQFMHFYDNGLFVGQYGTAGLQADGSHWPSGGYVIAGFVGNGFSPQFATVNNELYMWVNDESGHGPQRWHLSGINSINVLTGSGATGGTITTGTLEAKGTVATPSFSPAPGSYSSTQTVTISCATSGATIRYTTDGSTPTATTGAIYTAPVSVSATTTLKAIAYKLDMVDSSVATGTYTIQVAAPSFSPAAGTYTSAQTVTISTTTTGAAIRYTTDGSTPTSTTGTVYSTPVTINATATLKAIAYKSGMTNSTVTSGTYTIQQQQQVVAPSFSPAAGTYTSAQTVTISTTTTGATIRYTTDGSTPTSTTGTVYSTPVTINATATLKAIAYKSGMTNSTVTSGIYTINAGGNGTGLSGSYFNNKTLTAPAALTRKDSQVNFDWGSGSPDGAISADNFSVRWTGKVQATVAGSYTFSTTSDDGVRLWVNGQQVINNWTDHGSTTDTSAPVTLSAGQQVDVTMEFYENGGGAVAKLLWTPPSGTMVAIPQAQLYPSGTNDIPTTYVSTTTLTGSSTFLAPSGSLFGVGWFNVNSVNTLLKTPTPPTGFDASWAAAGGCSQNRINNVDLTNAGITNTSKMCQVPTSYGSKVTTTLTLNFSSGQGGKVHINWGSWTDDTRGGAKLTVVDNTAGVTYDGATYPDMTYTLDYNAEWSYRETVFQVGACKSLTISVEDNNIWSQYGRAWLSAIYVEPLP